MDVTVLGGCIDPSADVLKRLREIGVYLIKFETGNDNLITEGILRLKLRLTTWDRQLYAVVVNSGADAFGDFEWTTVDYMKKIIEINCFQVARVTKAVMPLLRNSTESRLIFHSSIHTKLTEPGTMPFAMSKMALEGMIDALRLECLQQNIFVTTVAPGVFYHNSPYLISKSNFEKVNDKLYKELSVETKQLITKDAFAERLEQVTTRLNGINTLKPVIDDYIHALFSEFPYHRYEPVDLRIRMLLFVKKYMPLWLSDWAISANVLNLSKS